jgi:hypothetical protein
VCSWDRLHTTGWISLNYFLFAVVTKEAASLVTKTSKNGIEPLDSSFRSKFDISPQGINMTQKYLKVFSITFPSNECLIYIHKPQRRFLSIAICSQIFKTLHTDQRGD